MTQVTAKKVGEKVVLKWGNKHEELTLRELFVTPWTMATYLDGEDVDPRKYHGQPFEYLRLWDDEYNDGLTPDDEDYDELHIIRFGDGREFLAQREEIFQDVSLFFGEQPWDLTPGAASPGTPYPNPWL